MKKKGPSPAEVASNVGRIPYRPFSPNEHLAEEREALISEYLVRKAKLLADAKITPNGNKVVNSQMIATMTGREAAGMMLRTYGSNALRAFRATMDRPARRRYEKMFPGVSDLLRKHCPDGNA